MTGLKLEDPTVDVADVHKFRLAFLMQFFVQHKLRFRFPRLRLQDLYDRVIKGEDSTVFCDLVARILRFINTGDPEICIDRVDQALDRFTMDRRTTYRINVQRLRNGKQVHNLGADARAALLENLIESVCDEQPDFNFTSGFSHTNLPNGARSNTTTDSNSLNDTDTAAGCSFADSNLVNDVGMNFAGQEDDNVLIKAGQDGQGCSYYYMDDLRLYRERPQTGLSSQWDVVVGPIATQWEAFITSLSRNEKECDLYTFLRHELFELVRASLNTDELYTSNPEMEPSYLRAKELNELTETRRRKGLPALKVSGDDSVDNGRHPFSCANLNGNSGPKSASPSLSGGHGASTMSSSHLCAPLTPGSVRTPTSAPPSTVVASNSLVPFSSYSMDSISDASNKLSSRQNVSTSTNLSQSTVIPCVKTSDPSIKPESSFLESTTNSNSLHVAYPYETTASTNEFAPPSNTSSNSVAPYLGSSTDPSRATATVKNTPESVVDGAISVSYRTAQSTPIPVVSNGVTLHDEDLKSSNSPASSRWPSSGQCYQSTDTTVDPDQKRGMCVPSNAAVTPVGQDSPIVTLCSASVSETSNVESSYTEISSLKLHTTDDQSLVPPIFPDMTTRSDVNTVKFSTNSDPSVSCLTDRQFESDNRSHKGGPIAPVTALVSPLIAISDGCPPLTQEQLENRKSKIARLEKIQSTLSKSKSASTPGAVTSTVLQQQQRFRHNLTGLPPSSGMASQAYPQQVGSSSFESSTLCYSGPPGTAPPGRFGIDKTLRTVPGIGKMPNDMSQKDWERLDVEFKRNRNEVPVPRVHASCRVTPSFDSNGNPIHPDGAVHGSLACDSSSVMLQSCQANIDPTCVVGSLHSSSHSDHSSYRPPVVMVPPNNSNLTGYHSTVSGSMIPIASQHYRSMPTYSSDCQESISGQKRPFPSSSSSSDPWQGSHSSGGPGDPSAFAGSLNPVISSRMGSSGNTLVSSPIISVPSTMSVSGSSMAPISTPTTNSRSSGSGRTSKKRKAAASNRSSSNNTNNVPTSLQQSLPTQQLYNKQSQQPGCGQSMMSKSGYPICMNDGLSTGPYFHRSPCVSQPHMMPQCAYPDPYAVSHYQDMIGAPTPGGFNGPNLSMEGRRVVIPKGGSGVPDGFPFGPNGSVHPCGSIRVPTTNTSFIRGNEGKTPTGRPYLHSPELMGFPGEFVAMRSQTGTQHLTSKSLASLARLSQLSGSEGPYVPASSSSMYSSIATNSTLSTQNSALNRPGLIPPSYPVDVRPTHPLSQSFMRGHPGGSISMQSGIKDQDTSLDSSLGLSTGPQLNSKFSPQVYNPVQPHGGPQSMPSLSTGSMSNNQPPSAPPPPPQQQPSIQVNNTFFNAQLNVQQMNYQHVSAPGSTGQMQIHYVQQQQQQPDSRGSRISERRVTVPMAGDSSFYTGEQSSCNPTSNFVAEPGSNRAASYSTNHSGANPQVLRSDNSVTPSNNSCSIGPANLNAGNIASTYGNTSVQITPGTPHTIRYLPNVLPRQDVQQQLSSMTSISHSQQQHNSFRQGAVANRCAPLNSYASAEFAPVTFPDVASHNTDGVPQHQSVFTSGPAYPGDMHQSNTDIQAQSHRPYVCVTQNTLPVHRVLYSSQSAGPSKSMFDYSSSGRVSGDSNNWTAMGPQLDMNVGVPSLTATDSLIADTGSTDGNVRSNYPMRSSMSCSNESLAMMPDTMNSGFPIDSPHVPRAMPVRNQATQSRHLSTSKNSGFDRSHNVNSVSQPSLGVPPTTQQQYAYRQQTQYAQHNAQQQQQHVFMSSMSNYIASDGECSNRSQMQFMMSASASSSSMTSSNMVQNSSTVPPGDRSTDHYPSPQPSYVPSNTMCGASSVMAGPVNTEGVRGLPQSVLDNDIKNSSSFAPSTTPGQSKRNTSIGSNDHSKTLNPNDFGSLNVGIVPMAQQSQVNSGRVNCGIATVGTSWQSSNSAVQSVDHPSNLEPGHFLTPYSAGSQVGSGVGSWFPSSCPTTIVGSSYPVAFSCDSNSSRDLGMCHGQPVIYDTMSPAPPTGITQLNYPSSMLQ